METQLENEKEAGRHAQVFAENSKATRAELKRIQNSKVISYSKSEWISLLHRV